jgi:uncharacterized UBP type Zn finger protein
MVSRYDKAFKGLQNKGENNCYLNVVIQSLWHLASFRNNFVRHTKQHLHSNREVTLRRTRSKLLESFADDLLHQEQVLEYKDIDSLLE